MENLHLTKNIVKENELGNHKGLHNSEYDSLMTLEYVKLLLEQVCDFEK